MVSVHIPNVPKWNVAMAMPNTNGMDSVVALHCSESYGYRLDGGASSPNLHVLFCALNSASQTSWHDGH